MISAKNLQDFFEAYTVSIDNGIVFELVNELLVRCGVLEFV